MMVELRDKKVDEHLRTHPGRRYIFRNQVATARGSNLTQLPTRKEGILPAAACLKIVTSETQRKPASSFAVIARPIFSILSARDTTDQSPPA